MGVLAIPWLCPALSLHRTIDPRQRMDADPAHTTPPASPCSRLLVSPRLPPLLPRPRSPRPQRRATCQRREFAPQAPRPSSSMVLPSYVTLPTLPPRRRVAWPHRESVRPMPHDFVLRFGNTGILIPRLEAPPLPWNMQLEIDVIWQFEIDVALTMPSASSKSRRHLRTPNAQKRLGRLKGK